MKKSYKEGDTPKGYTYSICLNQQVDEWTREVWEERKRLLGGRASPPFFYKGSAVMIQPKDKQIIYGNISHLVREDITEQHLINH